MIRLIRTDSENKDFITLVSALDADLAKRDGAEHSFYSQFNKITKIKFAVVAYENETPVGCGAIKEYEADTMEVKRMYVTPEHRGKGIATQVLTALENWAAEMLYKMCTRNRQTTTGSYSFIYQQRLPANS
jgi:putative acetyltransferase